MRKYQTADLLKMSESELDQFLDRFVDDMSKTPNGELCAIQAEVARFEEAYSMDSAEMLRKVGAGEMGETAQLCSWRIAYEIQGQLESGTV